MPDSYPVISGYHFKRENIGNWNREMGYLLEWGYWDIKEIFLKGKKVNILNYDLCTFYEVKMKISGKGGK